MHKNTALLIASIVFGIVAIMHLLRIFYTWDITISSYDIPMWVSWVAFVVASILCIIMFRARSRR